MSPSTVIDHRLAQQPRRPVRPVAETSRSHRDPAVRRADRARTAARRVAAGTAW